MKSENIKKLNKIIDFGFDDAGITSFEEGYLKEICDESHYLEAIDEEGVHVVVYENDPTADMPTEEYIYKFNDIPENAIDVILKLIKKEQARR